MKKMYDKPVLTAELFDVDDVITVSSPSEQTERLDNGSHVWESAPLPLI